MFQLSEVGGAMWRSPTLVLEAGEGKVRGASSFRMMVQMNKLLLWVLCTKMRELMCKKNA
jgi:hypothetical protein